MTRCNKCGADVSKPVRVPGDKGFEVCERCWKNIQADLEASLKDRGRALRQAQEAKR